jgi:hypothetical protein
MSINQSLRVAIAGNKPAPSTIRVQPTSARTTKYSYAGWQWRRRYSIANNGDFAMSRYPYAIDLGLTNALVSGSKALASGNDLRVTYNGIEIARTLVNWNDATFTTLCWVILPDVAPGSSVTLEVIYGNASAGIPPTLAYPDLPAFNLTTAGTNRTTNAKWVYDVSRVAGNAAKGVWWIERGDAQPGKRDTNIPGGWQAELTWDNGLDDVEQTRWTAYTDTLVYYMGRFDAKRSRDGSLIGTDVMAADGVSIEVPVGITSVRAQLECKNEEIAAAGSDPVGKLVILGRNSDDADWVPFYANTTKYSTTTTIATATYTPAATMQQIAFAVWPYNGISVPANATQGRVVQASWVGVLELNVDSSKIATTTTLAETACYDMTGQVSVARDGTTGGIVGTAIRLGNYSQADGVGTPHLMMALNEQIVLDNDRRTAQIWNSGYTAVVESVPSGCVSNVDTVADYLGTTSEQAALALIDVRPVTNPLANPSFATDATGWTRLSATSGMTAAAIARSTAQSTSSPASGTVVVSASTAGASAEAVDYTDLIALGLTRGVAVACDVRSTSANVVMRPAVYWYDASGTYLSRSIGADYTPTINTWYRRLVAGVAPANATQYRVALVTFARTAAATGTVFVDTITVNDNEIRWDDPDGGGSISVNVEWVERYA